MQIKQLAIPVFMLPEEFGRAYSHHFVHHSKALSHFACPGCNLAMDGGILK